MGSGVKLWLVGVFGRLTTRPDWETRGFGGASSGLSVVGLRPDRFPPTRHCLVEAPFQPTWGQPDGGQPPLPRPNCERANQAA